MLKVLFEIGDGTPVDLKNHLHALAGALDRLSALGTILRSQADLPQDKRLAYANYLEEARDQLSDSLEPLRLAIESALNAKK